MSRNTSLSLTALALGASTLLGACTDMYLDRRDTVSFEAGDAVAVNKMAHIIDPWPAAAGNRNLSYDGQRMQAASERYRNNKVTPLATSQTSSVQYAPVVAPAAPAAPAASPSN